MLHQRKATVDACTTLIRQAEKSNDLASADTAECYAALLRARVEHKLPISIGTAMVAKLLEAVQAQHQARELMLEAHLTAPEVIRAMGLERMYGDNSECPPNEGRSRDAADIVVLPRRAA